MFNNSCVKATVNEFNAFVWFNDIPTSANIKLVNDSYIRFIWYDKDGKELSIDLNNIIIEKIYEEE